MTSTRFDVVATFPAGASASRVPEMLRSLLAERFQMAVHRETREQPVYALVVGKNGPRMKEAAADSNAAPADSVPVRSAGPDTLDCGATRQTTAPAGWMLNQGPGHLQGHGINMASLANTLAALLGRAVVDQTGLKGNYDFDLDYDPGERGRNPDPPAGTPEPDGEPLLTAIQSQLGLKLEARKAPVEIIVVDHAERTPAAN
jgi:uncharacterized protein (TIGR03435 family)